MGFWMVCLFICSVVCSVVCLVVCFIGYINEDWFDWLMHASLIICPPTTDPFFPSRRPSHPSINHPTHRCFHTLAHASINHPTHRFDVSTLLSCTCQPAPIHQQSPHSIIDFPHSYLAHASPLPPRAGRGLDRDAARGAARGRGRGPPAQLRAGALPPPQAAATAGWPPRCMGCYCCYRLAASCGFGLWWCFGVVVVVVVVLKVCF